MKTHWPADKVERRALSSLVPAARNARTHSPEQVAQLAASIREWGWTVPVLVDEGGGLIAGHGRVLAAAELGLTSVPTMVAAGWSEAQIRAYRIADNKLALNAGWDDDLLRLELGELRGLEVDMGLLGFGTEELAARFVNIKPAAAGLDTELYVFDLVLAHVREWGWHFATEFCWERPGVPKGVTQRFKNQFEPIYQFVRNRWKMRPGAVRHESDKVPIAGGPGSGETSWARAQGASGGAGIVGTFGAAKKRRNGTKITMSDEQGKNIAPGEYIGPGLAYPGNRLPTFASSHQATGHAAAFPVGLPRFFCLAYTDENDLVFDPFSGSGSTIMAADVTKRDGAACDISPAYVDVAVRRWQNFTGEDATLDGDGRTFATIAEERLQAVAA